MDRNSPKRWKDNEIQEWLDRGLNDASEGAATPGSGPDPAADQRIERYRRLYSLLSDLERPEPSPGFEQAVMKRVLAVPGPSRLRTPRWLPVGVAAALVASTSLSVGMVRYLGAVAGPLAEMVVESRMSILMLPIKLLSQALRSSGEASAWLLTFLDQWTQAGRALVGVFETEPVRLALAAILVFNVLIILLWSTGRRFLHARKGTFHGFIG